MTAPRPPYIPTHRANLDPRDVEQLLHAMNAVGALPPGQRNFDNNSAQNAREVLSIALGMHKDGYPVALTIGYAPPPPAAANGLYTRQEIFDIVVTHFRRQRRPAIGSDGQCVYRTRSYDMCAVGCLIPDSAYEPAWDDPDSPLGASKVAAAGGIPGVDDSDPSIHQFLAAMQSDLHDKLVIAQQATRPKPAFMELFEPAAKAFAAVNNLTYTRPGTR